MLKRHRHSQTEDAVIESNVTKMVQAGVIEEGNGAWGFPVLLVRNKDGEVRFCIHYRALNKVTKKDVYPLPRIDETLEALGGAVLFTTLDLHSGYWQISVAPEGRDKTAFTSKQGSAVRVAIGLNDKAAWSSTKQIRLADEAEVKSEEGGLPTTKIEETEVYAGQAAGGPQTATSSSDGGRGEGRDAHRASAVRKEAEAQEASPVTPAPPWTRAAKWRAEAEAAVRAAGESHREGTRPEDEAVAPWAPDVAGPFPIASGGERYVVAAVEYVTRYAVAKSVTEHTAESVATFLMNEVVLKFDVTRELLTDGAPELTGRVIEPLLELLQARQTNPVPYRPQMIGLVERFHRSCKACVATFIAGDEQNDWSTWVQCAVYAYNAAKHSTVALTSNELMMGRRLRLPNELLRQTSTNEAGELTAYHERLVAALERGRACAERARAKEQARQARYYDRRAKQARTFGPGDRVWVFNPPRGHKATKFVHMWMVPMRVVESAGYENYGLRREHKNGKPGAIIADVSFIVSFRTTPSLLERIADDIKVALVREGECDHEDVRRHDVETAAAVVRTAARGRRATTTGGMENARGEQLRGRSELTVGAASWWSGDGDDAGIEPGSMSLSMSSNPELVNAGRTAAVRHVG
ncbi:unnamed protein product [Phytophthora fragariaefolia]|uniref:Unnamed protein product n=1 Tax=Phytophthora fragariaefolia TaxID=1490495 RepID=A0A9W6UB71_9STRA|nr:unnamed protein product [Phytophthora fragariaefolia]